jgi:hypothetical protein
MASWLILLLVAITPGSNRNAAATIKQRVDLIELNHFVDQDGREVFQQVIFYDWSRMNRRFHVRAWRLIKHDSQIPTRHWSPVRYQCQWHDDGLLRQVRAPQLRETWSQSDPERVNRALLPEDQRVPLAKPELAKPEPAAAEAEAQTAEAQTAETR